MQKCAGLRRAGRTSTLQFRIEIEGVLLPKQVSPLGRAEADARREAEKCGYELIDVELVKESTGRFLRFYIDKEGGVSLDDCESYHRRIQPLMENIDYDYMEVSSPGADRPLKTERDFERAVGQMVEVRLYRPVNGVKVFTGELAGLENGRVKRYRLPRSILAFMQVLEYDRSFLASRILFDRFNGSLIISGAFGLFKKDTVIAVGGYDNKTMGEDMELVVKLHEYCTINGIDYAIRYATDAICWTQVPERLRDLCKQRKRWHLGLFQSMYKHRVMFSNHRFGAVSFVSYLYFLIYELLSPFIEVFGVFTMVLAWWCDLINVPFMLLFFLIYAVFGGVLTLTAFFSRIYTADLTLSFGDGLKAVCLCLFELVFLRFILAWVRCTAFVGYKKKKLSWGRIERRKIDLK